VKIRPRYFADSAKASGLPTNGSGFLVLCWWRPGSPFFCGPYKLSTVPLLITSFAILIFASLLSWQTLGQQSLGTSGLSGSEQDSFWQKTLTNRLDVLTGKLEALWMDVEASSATWCLSLDGLQGCSANKAAHLLLSKEAEGVCLEGRLSV